jgi:hypothetical protein
MNLTTTPEQQAMNLRLANPTGAAAAAVPGQGGPGVAAPPPMPGAPSNMITPELILQMYNQRRQEDIFNDVQRNLGIIGAGMYPGRPHPALGIMARGSGLGGADENSTIQNILALQGVQQQRAQAQDIWNNAEEFGKPYGASGAEVRNLLETGGLPAVSKYIETMSGVGNPALTEQRRAENALTRAGKPIPWTVGDPVSFGAYQAGQVTNQRDVIEEQNKSTEAYPNFDKQHNDIENTIAALQKNGHVVQAVQSLGPTTGVGGALRVAVGNLDPQTSDAAALLQKLNNQLYAAGWDKGSRLAAVEAQRLQQQYSTLTNPNQTAQQINDQLNGLATSQKTAHVNAALAAGQPVSPEDYALGSDIYKPGGKFANGGRASKDIPSFGGGPLPATATSPTGEAATPQTLEDVQKLSPGTKFIVPYGPSKGQIGTR